MSNLLPINIGPSPQDLEDFAVQNQGKYVAYQGATRAQVEIHARIVGFNFNRQVLILEPPNWALSVSAGQKDDHLFFPSTKIRAIVFVPKNRLMGMIPGQSAFPIGSEWNYIAGSGKPAIVRIDGESLHDDMVFCTFLDKTISRDGLRIWNHHLYPVTSAADSAPKVVLPHKCPHCNSPAYHGFLKVECSNPKCFCYKGPS